MKLFSYETQCPSKTIRTVSYIYTKFNHLNFHWKVLLNSLWHFRTKKVTAFLHTVEKKIDFHRYKVIDYRTLSDKPVELKTHMDILWYVVLMNSKKITFFICSNCLELYLELHDEQGLGEGRRWYLNVMLVIEYFLQSRPFDLFKAFEMIGILRQSEENDIFSDWETLMFFIYHGTREERKPFGYYWLQ